MKEKPIMTELEVLYKLERAYIRKWWQFWVPKQYISANYFLCPTLSMMHLPALQYIEIRELLESVAIKEKADFERKEDGLWWPAGLKEPRLQTIRSAIAKLKEKGNI